MSLFGFLNRNRATAPVARERLQILLAHERAIGGGSDLVATLKEEILAVIAKHFPLEREKVQVKLDRGDAFSTLEIDIEVPTMAKRGGPGGGARRAWPCAVKVTRRLAPSLARGGSRKARFRRATSCRRCCPPAGSPAPRSSASGLQAAPVVNWLPSETNRFLMSCVWPNLFTTPSRAFSLMRLVPMLCVLG